MLHFYQVRPILWNTHQAIAARRSRRQVSSAISYHLTPSIVRLIAILYLEAACATSDAFIHADKPGPRCRVGRSRARHDTQAGVMHDERWDEIGRNGVARASLESTRCWYADAAIRSRPVYYSKQRKKILNVPMSRYLKVVGGRRRKRAMKYDKEPIQRLYYEARVRRACRSAAFFDQFGIDFSIKSLSLFSFSSTTYSIK